MRKRNLDNSFTVLVYYTHQKAFIDWNLGYSSAVAMVLFVLVLLVTIIQFRGQARKERAWLMPATKRRVYGYAVTEDNR